MPPDQTIGAWLAEPPAAITFACAGGFDAGVDAHFGQILLDRLSDTRLRIGIHHVQFGSKTVGETRFAEQLLRFCRVVAETLICLVITGHGGWQWLVGRRRASINDAHDAIFVDRHVHRPGGL